LESTDNLLSSGARKAAIVFNCNDGQLSMISVLVESARDPARGNYQGDFWAVSTELSAEAKAWLSRLGVHILENPMDFLWTWNGRREAAAYTARGYTDHGSVLVQLVRTWLSWMKRVGIKTLQLLKSQTRSASEKTVEDYFKEYRNKRMSKLLFLDFLEKQGRSYDNVFLCDTDIYIQGPLTDILEQLSNEKLYYWKEEDPIEPGSYLGWKNQIYLNTFGGRSAACFGSEETNIGFMAGTPKSLHRVLKRQKELYLREDHRPLIRRGWHEQDFFRLVMTMHPEWFACFKPGSVIHLCSGGLSLIEETSEWSFQLKSTHTKPTAIHFAGGTWKSFPSVSRIYQAQPEESLPQFKPSRTKREVEHASA
jgi:hypothetical protein